MVVIGTYLEIQQRNSEKLSSVESSGKSEMRTWLG